MNKLNIVIMKWDSEVEEQEIELIERGIPPYSAHEMAVSMITSRRRKEYADKSRG
jgi:hypothetical protein